MILKSLCVVFREPRIQFRICSLYFGWNHQGQTSDLQPQNLGGHKAVVRPVPIPNTAVKHSLADGSSPIGSARVGSRQSLQLSRRLFSGFFCRLYPRQAIPIRSGAVPLRSLYNRKGRTRFRLCLPATVPLLDSTK